MRKKKEREKKREMNHLYLVAEIASQPMSKRSGLNIGRVLDGANHPVAGSVLLGNRTMLKKKKKKKKKKQFLIDLTV